MGKNEAESYVTDYMEGKYRDSFEVLSIQKMDLGHDEFRDHIYRMKFHSAALDSDIDIDVRRVSRDIIENYEQVLYEKRVLDEIGSVKKDQSGWSVRECSPHFENYWNAEKSAEFEEYKRDRNKLVLKIAVMVDKGDAEKTASTLYDYVNVLHGMGYNISLDVESENGSKRLKIWESDEFLPGEIRMATAFLLAGSPSGVPSEEYARILSECLKIENSEYVRDFIGILYGRGCIGITSVETMETDGSFVYFAVEDSKGQKFYSCTHKKGAFCPILTDTGYANMTLFMKSFPDMNKQKLMHSVSNMEACGCGWISNIKGKTPDLTIQTTKGDTFTLLMGKDGTLWNIKDKNGKDLFAIVE